MNRLETKIGQQIVEDNFPDYNSLPEKRHSDLIDYSTLIPKELIEKKISFERHETININKIFLDRAITDQSHAQEIGKSMKGKRGQLTPILVRARLDEENEVVYDIIDGFHRTLGGIKEGLETINATVVYSCSDQEMYDLRILAANSVKSVQFSRLAEWIINSYKSSNLPENIDICQAFALTVNDSNRSLLSNNLNHDQIFSIKEWCTRKSDLWQRTPISIYQDLILISKSNPELVKEVRNANNGSERVKNLTRGKLELIAGRFPGEENYHLQLLIGKYILEHKLQREDVLQLVNNLESQYLSDLTDQRIVQIMESTQHETKINKRNKIEKKKPEEKPENLQPKLKEALATIAQKEAEINKLKEIKQPKPKEAIAVISNLQEIIKSNKNKFNVEIGDLQIELNKSLVIIAKRDAEINELKQDTGINNESAKNIIDKLSNWVNNPKYSLSKTEKQIIQLFLYRPDLNIFKAIKGIANNTQTTALILSAINKKLIIDDENRHS